MKRKLIVVISLFFLASCASVPVRDSPRYHTEQEVIEAVRGMAWLRIKNTAGQKIVVFDNPATTAPLDAIVVVDENGVFMEFWIFENGEFVLAYKNGEQEI